ncbi:efflux RND transporter periplasmic adaptor subunit [Paraburkholderia sp. NMBU_R16]|uniref:efflux RND transporter periplasmic adaptor subunit n=1 Tax=Paraburkholderia sp. NMBU_R16 TaxID=2698676 RepID=UPI0015669824|nr:efflux RND transporter periplasmic adaptor subunit [Paraburkholderia sp. NMBU_R16]NRO98887.1 efflux RND transporter periplasmic adaptor subunit [Paraburkholderia sp. NMBU_R16]
MTEKTHASLRIPVQDTGEEQARPRRQREWRPAGFAILAVMLLAAGALRTVAANIIQNRSVALTTQQNAKQYVDVVLPKQTEGSNTTLLPGTLRGFVESPIYARATGYLLHWYVDIGAHVRQGQLLAELDTPEIDQELAQAVAQRDQMQASLGLAKTSYERWQQLRQRDAVSQQELDERRSTYNQDVANLAAAEANVARLRQLESFKRIVAPFTGVITQRNVDVGDLIDAGSGASRALFALAQADTLRVYVQIPQAYAQNVSMGEDVIVTQAELPGQQFHGKITHVSGAIDVSTRSLEIEVTLPNPDGRLRPGAYVQVAVPSPAQAQLTVPGNALLFRAEGPRLAVVDNHGVVHLRPVTIAQDLGLSLEIASGIQPTDRIIINPSDSIEDGDHVVVAQTNAQTREGGRPGQGPERQQALKDKGAS